MSFFVYVLKCSDDTFYTGYTTNLKNRLKVHNGEGDTKSAKTTGAKYTRGRRPVILYYSEEINNKSSAMKREYEIKQFTRKQKEELIAFKKNNMAKGQDRKKEKKKPKKDKDKK
jgi:putative endonuclease